MPYNPSDPVLGTDMTQGEWDQLRELMRKAEAGGKMNELLTVHKKEVKNAPMNRSYPPDDDDWKDCMETHVPPSPSKVHAPTGSNSSAASAAPSGALWPDAYSQNAYKVPPTTPPPTLQAGGNSGIVDPREYHKKWQDRPYDPNDDPWLEDDAKDPKNDKPVIQLFGNVVQTYADIAEAKAAAAAIAEIANRYCADADGQSAGFPKFNAQVPLPPAAKADPPILPASVIGNEKAFQEQKGRERAMTKVGSLTIPKVASRNLRKVAKSLRRVARMTKVAKMWQRENSKVNSKERMERRGSRVLKDQLCLRPKLLVRSVHASPKSLRRLWKATRTKCMTMAL